MTSRRAFVAGAVTVLTAPLAVRAQPVTKMARIGILGLASTPTPHKPYPTWLNSFFEGLRERGWVDGQNIAFEFREGPDLQANATELVRLKVDVIVTLSTPRPSRPRRPLRRFPLSLRPPTRTNGVGDVFVHDRANQAEAEEEVRDD